MGLHNDFKKKKEAFSKNFYKISQWWSAKIVKITALMFFLPFSESYKLTRKNPNVLELVVVMLYQGFFRLRTQ